MNEVKIGNIYRDRNRNRCEVVSVGSDTAVLRMRGNPNPFRVMQKALNDPEIYVLEEAAEDQQPREQDIKPGSVVRLKSGGPKMVVGVVTKDIASCVWFTEWGDRQRIKGNDIYLACLQLVEDNDATKPTPIAHTADGTPIYDPRDRTKP